MLDLAQKINASRNCATMMKVFTCGLVFTVRLQSVAAEHLGKSLARAAVLF